MPELRTDWLLGRCVLIAENRAERPNEFEASDSVCDALEGHMAAVPSAAIDQREAFVCPFCRGFEHRTPPTLFALHDALGNWKTRVVVNRYPAVGNLDIASNLSSPTGDAMYGVASFPADGAHEVIIESPRHVDRLGALSIDELRDVLTTYAQRLRFWRSDGRLAYGLVFKNQGARAGASLAHLHSQLIALPFVPAAVENELQRAAAEGARIGGCPYCQLVEIERAAAERTVYDAEGFLAFCPFASLQPLEVWLMPARHESSFEDSGPEGLELLANVLGEVIRRVEICVPNAAYNLILRTATWQEGRSAAGHWRVEIVPRTASIAGFELASGIFINPVAPERAASKLRSI